MSARRTAEVMPDYPITLVADVDPGADCFDEVYVDDSSFEKADKPRTLRQTPYERTVYFDTDIYLEDRIDLLFEVLDNFELAAKRNRDGGHLDDESDVPDAFPEYHAGLIAYRDTEAVMDLFSD